MKKQAGHKAALIFLAGLQALCQQCLSEARSAADAAAPADLTRVLPYGFEAMERLDYLPVLPPNGTQTKQFISYDPTGGNGYGVHLFKRYEENGEWVFFDEFGPGCLYRLQANVFGKNSALNPRDTCIRMYFDDGAEPQLEMTFAEFFGMGRNYTPPFTPPLAYYSEKGTYANMYYPFSFKKRLKIAARFSKGPPAGHSSWYQCTYLKYPPGAAVASWPASGVDSEAVRRQWTSIEERVASRLERADENLSSDAAGAGGSGRRTFSASLKPGERARVLELDGGGAIISMIITLSPWNKETFFNTHVRLCWDGHEPAADMPLGSLFGGGGDTIGAGEVFDKRLYTLLFGYDSKLSLFYSFWPMPFWRSAVMEITNGGSGEVVVNVDAEYRPGGVYPRDACGYFSAKRTIDVSPEGAYFSRAFHAAGWGKIMGIMMYCRDYAMDGDEFAYFDDSRTPQIHGDGTEDDHNQGWCGYAVQMPYWGGLFNGFNGGYRLYILEPYIFNLRADIFYEHSRLGAPEPGVRPKTDCIVWYYLAEPGSCNLKLTDRLDVCDAVSESEHEYVVSGETWAGTTASAYEKFEQGAPFPCADAGRAFTNYSEFALVLDPANEGVKLRRRANRNFGNVQRAEVYVDGERIDVPWYICDLPAPEHAAFLDTDFEIPGSFTRGKSRIRVRVRHVAAQPKNSNNEYYYWAYCYGRTPVAPRPPASPEIISASAAADGRAVVLKWFCLGEGVGSFLLERRAAAEEQFAKLAELPADMFSFMDEAVTPLNSYVYRLRAIGESGVSDPSAEKRVDIGPAPALENLALSAKASASSFWANDDKEPEKANDGRLDTRWNSSQGKMDGEWLALDWKEEKEIDTIVLHQETHWTRITSFTLRSKTAGRWLTLHEGREMGDTEIIRFPAVKTKGLVLTVNSTSGNTPTIKEFQVFCAAAAPQ